MLMQNVWIALRSSFRSAGFFLLSVYICMYFMRMIANDSSPLYLLNDNYLGNVDHATNSTQQINDVGWRERE